MRTPILEAKEVSKAFRRGGVMDRASVPALDRVNLVLRPRRTVALIGPSGSGKSTLGRCFAGLDSPDSGRILYRGRALDEMPPEERRRMASRIQLMMQDTLAIPSHMTVGEVAAEPLRVRGVAAGERRERAIEVMAEVGLAAALADWASIDLSGGQKRRLLLARALLAEPEVLILDEALASLDLGFRAQIANRLLDFQRRYDLAYLLIAHDLAMATYLADEVAVLEEGRLTGPLDIHAWLAMDHPLARAARAEFGEWG